MDLPIPPQVVYAGLGGTLLALFVATATNEWRPKVFFLLALRLAVGWQFMFEGMNKINSHWVGPTDTNKPFTSEPYFKVAPGYFGRQMRKMSGDPADAVALRVTPEKDWKLDGGFRILPLADQAKACPRPVAEEFDDLAKLATIADDKITAAKAAYARWVYGTDRRDAKIKYVGSDVPQSVPERLAHIKLLESQAETWEARRESHLGMGTGTETARGGATRIDVLTAYGDLAKDADAFIMELKKDLVAAVLDERGPGPFAAAKTDAEIDALLAAMPAPAKAAWDAYYAGFNTTYFAGREDEKSDEASKKMQARLRDWFADIDEYVGGPKPGYSKLAKAFAEAKPEKKADARKAAVAAINAKFAELKPALAAAVPADNPVAKSVAAEKPNPIKGNDKLTMWFLAVVGGCIFFGLFTRLSCVLAAGFLILTYLTHPPFPWYPLPPNTEGNPLFVNKNLIECLALLSLACLPTGRWLGLDALVHRLVFPPKAAGKKNVPAAV